MSATARIDELNAKVRAFVSANFRPKDGKKPAGIEQRQRATRVDKAVPPALQVLKCTFTAPEPTEIIEPVMSGVRGLGSGSLFVDPPTVEPVEVEWLSHRYEKADTSQVEQEKNLPADEAFEKLSQVAQGKGTILFIHGGGWYQHGPNTYRGGMAGDLARSSGMRVAQLDYRLAPQTAFPSQLCDLLVAYLSLLYPPEGCAHGPIDPSTLVLAGDSCGGNLALVFAQLVLQLGRQQRLAPSAPPTVTFNSRRVALPLPAGILTVSAACDNSAVGLPSWQRNRQHDIWDEEVPFAQAWWPSDSIWPSTPPRGDLYCRARAFTHPLVSPCLARDWTGCCPLWMAVGEERLADGDMLLARRSASQGVAVSFHQYARMPHVWPNVHRKLPQTTHVMERWGGACRQLVNSTPWSGAAGIFWEAEKLRPRELEIDSLLDYSLEEAEDMIRKAAEKRPVYTGSTAKERL